MIDYDERLDKLLEALNYLNELREPEQIDDRAFYELNRLYNESYNLAKGNY